VNLRLIQFGKTREAWLKQAIGEYLKRLSPMAKLEILELADVSISKAGSVEAVKFGEAQNCLKRLKPDDYVILLDEKGQMKSSLEFSEYLVSISHNKRVVFIIGGVYGTDLTLKQRSDAVLSLSELTFTHQMARLILVEQIYRALMIHNNRAYHY